MATGTFTAGVQTAGVFATNPTFVAGLSTTGDAFGLALTQVAFVAGLEIDGEFFSDAADLANGQYRR